MQLFRTKFMGILCAVALPLLLLSACGGGGDSGTSPSSGATLSTGSVSVSLTDNQARYNAVVLAIEKIGIVASNTPTTYYNSAAINELPVTINVLELPGEASLHLGTIDVPLPDNGDEVCFNQIRLVLAEKGNYLIENNDPTFYKHPLKTPSGQQSGVKVLVKEESFCLSEQDDAVNIAIEFDPKTAIGFNQHRGNPYQLKPTSMRIIKGEFFSAPESFIDGMVAVPTYNTAGGCESFATDPFVTLAAYNSASLVAKTVALATGPVNANEACAQWCESDASCQQACPLANSELCYYTGAFKLLLAEKDHHALTANWESFSGEMQRAEYNSTVLLELTGE